MGHKICFFYMEKNMDNYAKIISVTPPYLEHCDEGSQGMFSFSRLLLIIHLKTP